MSSERLKILAVSRNSPKPYKNNLWANSARMLARIVRGKPFVSHVLIAADAWLSWDDVSDLAKLTKGQRAVVLEILTSGVPFSRQDRIDIALSAGIQRATIHVPPGFFQPGSDEGLLERCIIGAKSLARSGLRVRLTILVDKFSRGYLDELALLASRAGIDEFEPFSKGHETLDSLCHMSKRRFELVRCGKLPRLPDEIILIPRRKIPGVSADLCPWKTKGWKGPESSESSVILLDDRKSAMLYCIQGPEPPLAYLGLVKNALGQVWKQNAQHPLNLLPMCESCPYMLLCPGIYSSCDENETHGASCWPKAPDIDHVSIEPHSIQNTKRRMMDLLPGEKLLVSGRTSRFVLCSKKNPVKVSARADSVDIQVAADLACSCGLVVKSYSLTWKTLDQSWWICVQKPMDEPRMTLRPGQSLLMVSNVCVTHCLMCGLPGMFQRSHAPVGQVLRHMVELRLLGMVRVDIFGGEVTLRPDLLLMAGFARSRGLRSSFITTGFGLSIDTVDRLVMSYVDQVEVALDADDDKTHDHIKGGLKVFRQATDLVTRLSKSQVMVDVNTVILKENMEKLTGIVDLVSSLGADHLRFFPCLRFGIHRGRQLPISMTDARKIWMEKIPGAKSRANAILQELEVCAPCDPFDEQALEAYSEGRPNSMPRHGRKCFAPDSEISILIDGSVIPCLNPSFYADLLDRPSNAELDPLWAIRASKEMERLVELAGVHPSCEACICFRDVPGPNHGTISSLSQNFCK